ncbi:MAG: baseplate J/gp47 family protein [Chitinophagaceae bacterium]|nr:baseplate J/gp47 family protein [Chitinophagaceae bacterium]
MEAPVFLNIDPEAIKSAIKADYEQMTGRILQPGQVEQLLINAFAYREYLLRAQINDAARMNLVEFSRAPFLDYLGQLVGVRRLTASPAVCTIKFIFGMGHGAVTVPAGIRIQSIDGQVVFITDTSVSVDAFTDEVTVSATCAASGVSGNNYEVNKISVILDPQPYLQSAQNTDTTNGGADAESDDDLRLRIKLAPESFSNAGSKGAYEYFARSANPAIADVSVTSPSPGQVNIYPLLEGGEIPNSVVLDEVAAACNSDKIRPLTDSVTVAAPSEVNYAITVSLTLVTGNIDSEIISVVTAQLQEYADSRKNKIGLDVVIENIIKRCMVDGVYSVTVSSPAATIVVGANEVAKCTAITVTVGGYSDE